MTKNETYTAAGDAQQLFDMYSEAPLLRAAMQEARENGQGNVAEHLRINEIVEIGKQLVGTKVEISRVEELRRKGEVPAIVKYTQFNEQNLMANRTTDLPTLNGVRYVQRDFFAYPKRAKGKIAEANPLSEFMVVKPRLPFGILDRYWIRMIDEETGLPLVTVKFLDLDTQKQTRDKQLANLGL